jgi:hypothetical protein
VFDEGFDSDIVVATDRGQACICPGGFGYEVRASGIGGAGVLGDGGLDTFDRQPMRYEREY